jgi:hypothetical protein
MKARYLLPAVGIVAGSIFTLAGTAHAANCGGQGAAPVAASADAPYVCTMPGIDITVQGVTRHFSGVLTANGTTVSVTFTMSAPLPVAVPLVLIHHTGKSGDGQPEIRVEGSIPAGSTTATVVDSKPCQDGQVDAKAIFTKPGDERGRVGGPWIFNGTPEQCIDTQTSVPATTVPVATTVPGTVAPLPSVPGTPAPSISQRATTLPATGYPIAGPLLLAATVLGFGYGMNRWSKRTAS